MKNNYFFKSIASFVASFVLVAVINNVKMPNWCIHALYGLIAFELLTFLLYYKKIFFGKPISFSDIEIGETFFLEKVGQKHYEIGLGWQACTRLYHLSSTEPRKNKYKPEIPLFFVSDELYENGKYIRLRKKEKLTKM